MRYQEAHQRVCKVVVIDVTMRSNDRSRGVRGVGCPEISEGLNRSGI